MQDPSSTIADLEAGLSGTIEPPPDFDPFKTKLARPQFVFGVDLDGVVADFYGSLRPLAAEWMGVPEASLPRDVDYGFKAWGFSPGEYIKLHRFAVTQRDLFRNMLVFEGAAPVLRRLSRRGVRIRIITHRLFVEHFHQTAASQTVAWLDYYGIPYFDLCFMSDKGAVEANLYIDDAPSNVLALLAADKDVIAFANSTNLSLQLPDRNRAADWAEVEERVMERFTLWTQQNP